MVFSGEGQEGTPYRDQNTRGFEYKPIVKDIALFNNYDIAI